MSNSHLFMSAGWVKAPLNNGVGRYIGQLQRIVIKFCKTSGSSKGVREFIESNVINFSRTNPGVAVYVKPRRHRDPAIVAEYSAYFRRFSIGEYHADIRFKYVAGNGKRGYMAVRNMSRDEIYKWLNHQTTRSGREVDRYRKLWHTETPSIQGVWSPHTFRDPKLNLVQFPLPNLAGRVIPQPTASEMLIDMFRKQQLEGIKGTQRSSTHEGQKQEG